jgi:hypothetical protein
MCSPISEAFTRIFWYVQKTKIYPSVCEDWRRLKLSKNPRYTLFTIKSSLRSHIIYYYYHSIWHLSILAEALQELTRRVLLVEQELHNTHPVPCNTLTDNTNEDLVNIKGKGDTNSRTLSRTSNTTETRNPMCNKRHLLACFTNIIVLNCW